MNLITQSLKQFVSKINPHHIRLFWLILALSLFVLGAGAPGDGSPGGW